MKKNAKKKLALHRETLQKLSGAESRLIEIASDPCKSCLCMSEPASECLCSGG